MTYSVLESWYESSGSKRVLKRRLAVTLTAEPLVLTASSIGFDKLFECSNACAISGGALYPCAVAVTSGEDTIYGMTTLPSTAGNISNTLYIVVTGL
jgi:hypothetical protein